MAKAILDKIIQQFLLFATAIQVLSIYHTNGSKINLEQRINVRIKMGDIMRNPTDWICQKVNGFGRRAIVIKETDIDINSPDILFDYRQFLTNRFFLLIVILTRCEVRKDLDVKQFANSCCVINSAFPRRNFFLANGTACQ